MFEFLLLLFKQSKTIRVLLQGSFCDCIVTSNACNIFFRKEVAIWFQAGHKSAGMAYPAMLFTSSPDSDCGLNH